MLTAAQLVAAGWSKDAIYSRAQRRWLRQLHRGVYLVGPLEVEHSRAMAAVLAAPDAALSHYPAAVVHRVRPPREGPMHVTTPRDARSRPGLTIHRAHLHPSDVTRRSGIPITSPARTILDLAADSINDAERALNEARILRLVTDASLDAQFTRYPRHRGTAALRKAAQTPGFTRSEGERRMFELIRRAGLPAPETNAHVEGYEVDLLWRAQKLIVEVDGYAFHSMRRSFEQDRRRDARLIAHGYRVVRVTWRQLTEEPEALVATLATALAA